MDIEIDEKQMLESLRRELTKWPEGVEIVHLLEHWRRPIGYWEGKQSKKKFMKAMEAHAAEFEIFPYKGSDAIGFVTARRVEQGSAVRSSGRAPPGRHTCVRPRRRLRRVLSGLRMSEEF